MNTKIARIKNSIDNDFKKIFDRVQAKNYQLIRIGLDYGLNNFNTKTLHKEIIKIKELVKDIKAIGGIYLDERD